MVFKTSLSRPLLVSICIPVPYMPCENANSTRRLPSSRSLWSSISPHSPLIQISALMSNSTSPSVNPAVDEPVIWLPLNKALGAYLLGTCFGLILYGLAVHQVYRYIHRFSRDSPSIQLLVAVLLALETLHTALTTYLCYNIFITSFSDPRHLLTSAGPWSLNMQPLLNSIIALLAQLFFARRVYLMGSWFRLPALFAMFLFLVGFGIAIVTTHLSFVAPDALSVSDIKWLTSAPVGASFLADLIFTTTIMTILYRNRRSEPRQNGTFLYFTVIVVANTGLLHCILNGLALVFRVVWDHNRTHLLALSISTISTRVYANSLLSVLNTGGQPKPMFIFDGTHATLNPIAQARRQVTATTWNVPQVSERAPRSIEIQIITTTDCEEWGKQGHPDAL